MKWVRWKFINGSFIVFSLYITPALILNAVFGTYIALDNELTASKAFTIISLFYILQEPIRSLPILITSVLEGYVSLKRIQSFLFSEEIDNSYVKRTK